MKRRSPIRHTVKAHIRSGRLVHSFERGKGQREKRRRFKRLAQQDLTREEYIKKLNALPDLTAGIYRPGKHPAPTNKEAIAEAARLLGLRHNISKGDATTHLLEYMYDQRESVWDAEQKYVHLWASDFKYHYGFGPHKIARILQDIQLAVHPFFRKDPSLLKDYTKELEERFKLRRKK